MPAIFAIDGVEVVAGRAAIGARSVIYSALFVAFHQFRAVNAGRHGDDSVAHDHDCRCE